MALEIKSLQKTYDGFSLSLDFSVEAGETLALVGASGSGKTTALNLIAGLAQPESGSVVIDGADITGLPAWKRGISVVFQEPALFPHLSVGGNITYGLFIRGVRRSERRRVMEETLEIVRLPGYASRRTDTLSGGERQRVAIARALASNPRALLLDEPFSSLDAPLRKSLRREFLEIRSHANAPCIFVTHDRDEAVMLGDRVALLSGGRVTECGPGRELLFAPKTEAAARFFGAGLVLPCKIPVEDITHNDIAPNAGEKREGWIEVSTPLGNLTVSPNSGCNSAASKIFIPEDAIHFEASSAPGFKHCGARCTGSLFEGKGLVLNLSSAPWEHSPQSLSLEVSAARRMPPPEPGSMIDLWVDQSLIRFIL